MAYICEMLKNERNQFDYNKYLIVYDTHMYTITVKFLEHFCTDKC